MDPKATQKAESKIKRMRSALLSMKNDSNNANLENDWEDFIYASSTFYAALEQGAKASNKSTPWYGKKKHERRIDPLLSYLHHARNCEQHGIEAISKRANSHIALKAGAMVTFRSDGENWNVENQVGDISYPHDRIMLVPVKDTRFNNVFDPPVEHLGKPIEDKSVVGIAALALAYMEQMLKEASSLSNCSK